MREIRVVASISDGATAIKIGGGEDEGGKVTLDIPGTEFAALLQLAAYARGKVLDVVVTVREG